MTSARDGTDRLFIVEQAGVIKMIGPGQTAPTTFLDIRRRWWSGGERGLLGLAFHPNTRRPALLRQLHADPATAPSSSPSTAVSAQDSNVADPAETVLLVIPHSRSRTTTAACSRSARTAILYIGIGDGGSANDPQRNAQNIERAARKILRIDVDTSSRRPAVLVAADQSVRRRGRPRTRSSPTACATPGGFPSTARPATSGSATWARRPSKRSTSSTAATILAGASGRARAARTSSRGGAVSRGSCSRSRSTERRRPLLRDRRLRVSRPRGSLPVGSYVYGDFCSGEIFVLENGRSSVALSTNLRISSFGEDEAGEIYVVGLDGAVARIAAVATAAPPRLTLAFNGKLRDRVGPGNTALSADGALDGTLMLTVSGGAGRTLTAVRMQTSAGGSWDTTSATGFWALGVARGPDGALLNQTGTMAVGVPLGDDESFTLFGADNRGRRFVPGRTLTVTATLAGGVTATARTTIPGAAAAPPQPRLTLAFNGKLRDRVGPGKHGAGRRRRAGRHPDADGERGRRPDADRGPHADLGRRVLGHDERDGLPGPRCRSRSGRRAPEPDGHDGRARSARRRRELHFVWRGQPGRRFVPGRTLTVTATFAGGATATATTTVP